MTGMIDEIAFVPERMRAAAAGGFSTATDLADWLVREAGVPFREAHHITGRAVKAAQDAGVMLPDLPLEPLTAIDARHDGRSEKRRVGKEGVRPCRYGGEPYN